MRTLLLFLIFLLLPAVIFASEYSCKVVKISDGDTITCLASGNKQVKIRLYGIDCPEKKQAYGQAARKALADMIAGKPVTVENMGNDRYGRIIGLIKYSGKNINLEMIKKGYAWVYAQFCKKAFCRQWQEVEQAARASRHGLWQDYRAIPPWKWRKRR